MNLDVHCSSVKWKGLLSTLIKYKPRFWLFEWNAKLMQSSLQLATTSKEILRNDKESYRMPNFDRSSFFDSSSSSYLHFHLVVFSSMKETLSFLLHLHFNLSSSSSKAPPSPFNSKLEMNSPVKGRGEIPCWISAYRLLFLPYISTWESLGPLSRGTRDGLQRQVM